MPKILSYFFKTADVLSYPLTNMTSTKGVNIIEDVVYDCSNPYILKADLYYPKLKIGNTPAIVYVHGGGFVQGDKRYRRGIAVAMARLGYLVMVINYGLCPQYNISYAINNTISAINWLYAKRETYQIEGIVLSGDSAGAFISAIASGAITNSQFYRQINIESCIKTKLLGLILFCGVYELEKLSDIKILSKNVDYSNILTGKSREQLRDSGLFYIMHPDNYITNNYPSTFVCHSTRDIFCKDTSAVLLDNLIRQGIEYEEFRATKIMDIHCFHLRPIIKSCNICIDRVDKFIKSLL